MKNVTLCGMLVAFLSTSLWSQTIIGTATDPSTGHVYHLVDFHTTYNWTSAKDYCENQTMSINGQTVSGHLATITSAAENNFLKNNLYSSDQGGDIYIGFNDDDTEGVYVWENGEGSFSTPCGSGGTGTTPAGTFTDWQSGKPDNFPAPCPGDQADDQDYGGLRWTGSEYQWNDVDNSATRYAVCEFSAISTSIPTMSEWALLLFGLTVFTLGLVVVYNIQTRLLSR